MLWFAEWMMASKEGVQQADQRSPFCFSLVIQKLIMAIKAKWPVLAISLRYLDDSVVADRTAHVHAVGFEMIAELGHDLGLVFNLVKNEAVFF